MEASETKAKEEWTDKHTLLLVYQRFWVFSRKTRIQTRRLGSSKMKSFTYTDLSDEITVFNSAKVHLYQRFGTQWCLFQGTWSTQHSTKFHH